MNCRCYDQATLADFVYFRWLFYSLGGCVGSVGSLWYTFRYPCHQDWSDLSTWTRFLSLFKTFFLFVIVAVRKNRLRLKNPGSFFWQLFLQKFCIKFLMSLRVDLVNFWCQNSFLRFSPEIRAWGRKGPLFGFKIWKILPRPFMGLLFPKNKAWEAVLTLLRKVALSHVK